MAEKKQNYKEPIVFLGPDDNLLLNDKGQPLFVERDEYNRVMESDNDGFFSALPEGTSIVVLNPDGQTEAIAATKEESLSAWEDGYSLAPAEQVLNRIQERKQEAEFNEKVKEWERPDAPVPGLRDVANALGVQDVKLFGGPTIGELADTPVPVGHPAAAGLGLAKGLTLGLSKPILAGIPFATEGEAKGVESIANAAGRALHGIGSQAISALNSYSDEPVVKVEPYSYVEFAENLAKAHTPEIVSLETQEAIEAASPVTDFVTEMLGMLVPIAASGGAAGAEAIGAKTATEVLPAATKPGLVRGLLGMAPSAKLAQGSLKLEQKILQGINKLARVTGEKGFKEALKRGAARYTARGIAYGAEGAAYGALYGLADLATHPDLSAEETWAQMGISMGFGAIGGAAGGVIFPAAGELLFGTPKFVPGTQGHIAGKAPEETVLYKLLKEKNGPEKAMKIMSEGQTMTHFTPGQMEETGLYRVLEKAQGAKKAKALLESGSVDDIHSSALKWFEGEGGLVIRPGTKYDTLPEGIKQEMGKVRPDPSKPLADMNPMEQKAATRFEKAFKTFPTVWDPVAEKYIPVIYQGRLYTEATEKMGLGPSGWTKEYGELLPSEQLAHRKIMETHEILESFYALEDMASKSAKAPKELGAWWTANDPMAEHKLASLVEEYSKAEGVVESLIQQGGPEAKAAIEAIRQNQAKLKQSMGLKNPVETAGFRVRRLDAKRQTIEWENDTVIGLDHKGNTLAIFSKDNGRLLKAKTVHKDIVNDWMGKRKHDMLVYAKLARGAGVEPTITEVNMSMLTRRKRALRTIAQDRMTAIPEKDISALEGKMEQQAEAEAEALDFDIDVQDTVIIPDYPYDALSVANEGTPEFVKNKSEIFGTHMSPEIIWSELFLAERANISKAQLAVRLNEMSRLARTKHPEAHTEYIQGLMEILGNHFGISGEAVQKAWPGLFPLAFRGAASGYESIVSWASKDKKLVDGVEELSQLDKKTIRKFLRNEDGSWSKATQWPSRAKGTAKKIQQEFRAIRKNTTHLIETTVEPMGKLFKDLGLKVDNSGATMFPKLLRPVESEFGPNASFYRAKQMFEEIEPTWAKWTEATENSIKFYQKHVDSWEKVGTLEEILQSPKRAEYMQSVLEAYGHNMKVADSSLKIAYKIQELLKKEPNVLGMPGLRRKALEDAMDTIIKKSESLMGTERHVNELFEKMNIQLYTAAKELEQQVGYAEAASQLHNELYELSKAGKIAGAKQIFGGLGRLIGTPVAGAGLGAGAGYISPEIVGLFNDNVNIDRKTAAGYGALIGAGLGLKSGLVPGLKGVGKGLITAFPGATIDSVNVLRQTFNSRARAKLIKAVKGVKMPAIFRGTRLFIDSEKQKEKVQKLMDNLVPLQDLKTSDALLQKRLGRISADLPSVGNAMYASSVRAIQYLGSTMPQAFGNPGQILTDQIPQYNDADMAKWLRRVDVVNDPTIIFEDIAMGTLTKEAIETMRVVYPELHKKWSEQLIAEIQEGKAKPGYATRLQISRFTGVALDSSVNKVAQLQATFAQQAAQQEGNNNSKPVKLKKAKFAENTMTKTQAIENKKPA